MNTYCFNFSNSFILLMINILNFIISCLCVLFSVAYLTLLWVRTVLILVMVLFFWWLMF